MHVIGHVRQTDFIPLLAVGLVFGVALPVRAQDFEGTYCAAAVYFIIGRDRGVRGVQEDCKGGDLMSLPTSEVALAARWCDLSKPIVNLSKDLICVRRATARPQREISAP